MKFQVRLDTLSPEQEVKETEYYNAVRLLRSNGFPNAEYVKTFVRNEKSEPGYIRLNENK